LCGYVVAALRVVALMWATTLRVAATLWCYAWLQRRGVARGCNAVGGCDVAALCVVATLRCCAWLQHCGVVARVAAALRVADDAATLQLMWLQCCSIAALELALLQHCGVVVRYNVVALRVAATLRRCSSRVFFFFE
jgi:hypothetical protein